MVPWTLTHMMDASTPAHPAHSIARPTMYSSTLNNNLNSWLARYDQNSKPTLRPTLTNRKRVSNSHLVNKLRDAKNSVYSKNKNSSHSSTSYYDHSGFGSFYTCARQVKVTWLCHGKNCWLRSSKLPSCWTVSTEQSAAGNEDDITDTRTELLNPAENWNVLMQLLHVTAVIIISITRLLQNKFCNWTELN